MKRFVSVATAAILAVVLDGAASAATVSTPALQQSGSERMVCVVSNVGSKEITILSADIVEETNGVAMGGFGPAALPACSEAVLQPGTGCSSDVTSNGFNPRIAHCVVAFSGSRKAVRAALWVVEGGSPFPLAGPVVPAN
jgi:hypothetical protein